MSLGSKVGRQTVRGGPSRPTAEPVAPIGKNMLISPKMIRPKRQLNSHGPRKLGRQGPDSRQMARAEVAPWARWAGVGGGAGAHSNSFPCFVATNV